MPRFFVRAGQIGVRDDGTKTVLITGTDASHITRSLRMKPGERLTVCDMTKREYDCTVLSLGDNVLLKVDCEKPSDTEPPYSLTLYQALIKGDKFDTVVQKSVECGVTRIVPVLTERCVVRLDKDSASKKIVRWQKIAEEAAKQCGRGIIPTVDGLMYYKQALSDAVQSTLPLFCYEGQEQMTIADAVKKVPQPDSVSVFVGSEGGFSACEAAAADEAGLISVGLGKRILRTETASSFAMACLAFAYEL